MKSENSFIVQFSGLKDGKHDFSFEIGTTFFEQNNFWVEIDGQLHLNFELEKRPAMLILNFDINGFVTIPCDRCTTPLNQKLTTNQTLYVKFGDENYQETDDIIILPENEYQIDITPYIFEFINLALPMKKVHKEGDCDEDMINTIRKYERENNNDNKEIDPRWAALKNLKNN